MARRRVLDVVPIPFLILGTIFLAQRYSTSASFERPLHLSFLTLLVAGGILYVEARRNGEPRTAGFRFLEPKPADRHALQIPFRPRAAQPTNPLLALLGRVRPPPRDVSVLLACVLARTWIWWRIVRMVQCSWTGVETFLPLVLVVFELTSSRGAPLPRTTKDATSHPSSKTGSLPAPYHIALALAWGVGASRGLVLLDRPTGAICPKGWRWVSFMPLAQVVLLLLDGVILAKVSLLQQDHGSPKHRTASFLKTVFLTSAAFISLLGVVSVFDARNLKWSFALHWVDVRDLVIDTPVVVGTLLSGIHLLMHLSPSAVALAATASSVYSHHLWGLLDNHTAIYWLPAPDGLLPGLVAALSAGALVTFAKDSPPWSRQAGEPYASKPLMTAYFVMMAVVLVVPFTVLVPAMPARDALPALIASATASSKSWISQAKTSKSLEEAVEEYRRRHSVPPPPSFDKWYEFAVSMNSAIIDDFGQIDKDVRPFWGLPPRTIRQRTSLLLEYPWLMMGGLRIQGGKVAISPHTPGTHRWMMDGMATMIEPFAQWLPDMDLALNLNDECRVAVAAEDMDMFSGESEAARTRLRHREAQALQGFSRSEGLLPPWSGNFMDENGAYDWDTRPWSFTDNLRRQTYYDVVAPTCPSNTPARSMRWWNKKTSCTSCHVPHTVPTLLGPVVSDWEAAADPCHQPDLAYMHGFLLTAGPMISTPLLFPIFSQSRVHGFSDVLIPSPWNFVGKTPYEESLDAAWRDKEESVYWRGGPSDGYAAHNSWTTFARARLVHEADELATHMARRETPPLWLAPPALDTDRAPFSVNVSFVGEFLKCDEYDCPAEVDTFYRYGGAGAGRAPGSGAADSGSGSGSGSGAAGPDMRGPPPPLPFNAHWAHRHLVDLDGAGFSGRFVEFVRSRSLVYRGALLRTWFEERLHAWRHFVPVDLRLGRGLWGLVTFFSGGTGEGEGDGGGGGGGGGGEGPELAENIAAEGREWASQVLRHEDMQVYMFRLLLEWGRVVDDRREEIGFVL